MLGEGGGGVGQTRVVGARDHALQVSIAIARPKSRTRNQPPPMSSWLPPPPPPPRPRYPTLIPDEDDDGAKTIPQFITQFIFLIILLVCQNPELMLIPLRTGCCGLSDLCDYLGQQYREAASEANEQRSLGARANRDYQQMQDEDDEEAGSERHERPPRWRWATQTGMARIQLHSKLARFQSRLDALRSPRRRPRPPAPAEEVVIATGAAPEPPTRQTTSDRDADLAYALTLAETEERQADDDGEEARPQQQAAAPVAATTATAPAISIPPMGRAISIPPPRAISIPPPPQVADSSAETNAQNVEEPASTTTSPLYAAQTPPRTPEGAAGGQSHEGEPSSQPLTYESMVTPSRRTSPCNPPVGSSRRTTMGRGRVPRAHSSTRPRRRSATFAVRAGGRESCCSRRDVTRVVFSVRTIGL